MTAPTDYTTLHHYIDGVSLTSKYRGWSDASGVWYLYDLQFFLLPGHNQGQRQVCTWFSVLRIHCNGVSLLHVITP